MQRALTAVDILFPERLTETLDRIFLASFASHQPVHEPKCLLALLENVHGKVKAEEIIQKVQQRRDNVLETADGREHAEHK